jgi:uncharacterized protein
MSGETARRAIDFLAAQSRGACTITFFGGEPMLEFERIKDLVSYGEGKYGRRVQYRMSTNGTLLRKPDIEFLRKHDVYFVLSVDGNERQHDANRTFASGRGSYAKIARRIPDVLEANPYTIAVSVIVPGTVEFVTAGVEHLFASGFRYVLQTLDYSAGWEKRDIDRLRRQYLEVAEFYDRALREGKKIYYGPFDERVKTRAQKPYTKGNLCDLANTQIAVAPSGRIYPCVQFVDVDGPEQGDYVIGDVRDGFDDNRRRHFVGENYAEKESCAGCALEGRCATYCGCVNWRATGDLKRVPPIVCEHERMLMPIVDRLANRLWKDKVPLFRRKFYDPTFPVSSYLEDCAVERRT